MSYGSEKLREFRKKVDNLTPEELEEMYNRAQYMIKEVNNDGLIALTKIDGTMLFIHPNWKLLSCVRMTGREPQSVYNKPHSIIAVEDTCSLLPNSELFEKFYVIEDIDFIRKIFKG